MTWNYWSTVIVNISGNDYLVFEQKAIEMNTAKEIRSDIFEILMQVEDIETLKVIRQELEVIYNKTYKREEKKTRPLFMEGVKGIREAVTLEQLKEEQNYSPCTYEEFRVEADAIDWGDVSLNELLEAIK